MGTAGQLSTAPTVRIATADDCDDIGALHVAAWRESYAGLLAPSRLAALDARERGVMWRSAIMQGTARGVYVACDGRTIIGFGACAHQRTAALRPMGYPGEVTALYVLRAGQRRGAGRSLMRAMARRLIAEGERGMALWVLRDNAGARRFYEQLGGMLVAERGDDRRIGDDVEVAYGWTDFRTLIA